MLDPDGCPTSHAPPCASCLDSETRGSMTAAALLSFALYGLIIGFLIGLAIHH